MQGLVSVVDWCGGPCSSIIAPLQGKLGRLKAPIAN